MKTRPCVEKPAITARGKIHAENFTIRPCDWRDIDAVMDMLRDEWPNLFKVPLDPMRIRLNLEFHLQNPRSGQWVLVNPNDTVFGFFGLYIFDRFVSGEVVADEYWWFINPQVRGRYGKRLVQAGEAWAKSMGVSSIQIGVARPKLQPLMERMGYHLETVMFAKAVE